MKDVKCIESITFDKDGNLIVQAWVEGYGKQIVAQGLFDAPEFDPGLCETTIDSEFLPPEVTKDKTEVELEELIYRYNLLDGAPYWEPITFDDGDRLLDLAYF